MKKVFEKPSLRKYDLTNKENIVASITYNDGVMNASWYFHEYDPATHEYVDGTKGCFDMLDKHFRTDAYPDLLTNANTWSTWITWLTAYISSLNPDPSPEAQERYTYYRGCTK